MDPSNETKDPTKIMPLAKGTARSQIANLSTEVTLVLETRVL